MQGFVGLLESVGTRFTKFLVHQHGVPVVLAGTIGLAGLGAMLNTQPVQGASNQTTVVQPLTCHIEGWYGFRHHHHHGNDGDADDTAGCINDNATSPADGYWQSSANDSWGGYAYVRGYGSGDGNAYGSNAQSALGYSVNPADGYWQSSSNDSVSGNSYIQGNGSANGYGNPNGLGQ